MNKFLLLLLIVATSTVTASAGTLSGKVTAKASGNSLAGANVYLKGTTVGAATTEEGIYFIKVDDGVYDVVCDYIGYAAETQTVEISGETSIDFALTEFLFAKTIEVIADRARDRETPVAFTNVDKERMEVQLGSQDIPLVLNTCPSVYATMQGGGAGDARINVRGFNQRNIAIMINGVPVNDMENGWIYWSNWDGIGDATSSIQLQRGLSAVNLATPSIGGTMNIITDPTAAFAGIKFKQEVGNDGFLKSTLIANSGLIGDKFAFNGALVRKLNDCLIDATWTNAWAYSFGASWNVNETNRLELYALGAPQRHGQNLYKQNIATYDKKYAEEIVNKSMKVTDSNDDGTSDWDEYIAKFPEQDRTFNQNWGEVKPSYNGKQAVNENTFDRYNSTFLNERENFYHKPQVNLNWYSSISSHLSLYTVLYYSGGIGGGTGLAGNYYRRDANGELSDDDWIYYDGPSPYSIDFNETIEMNAGPAGTYSFDKEDFAKDDGQSLGILRNSRNNQWTIGAIAKANYKITENIKSTFGVDWRTAEIEHYREVRDLLGGAYFVSTDNQFVSGPDSLGLGDKLDYYFTNTVDWYGAFAQSEFKNGPITAYGMIGLSTIRYTYINHFITNAVYPLAGDPNPESGKLKQKSEWIGGAQVKGGISYRITPIIQLFGNAGYVSKVPIFDAVINDITGDLVENAGNEKFTSFEIGSNSNLLENKLNIKGNIYYTFWKNRTVTDSEYDQVTGDDGIIVISNMDALHYGVELEAVYRPISLFRIDAAASVGDWKSTNDADALYKDYEGAPDSAFTIYVKNLKTGDAPQTQVAIAGSVFPFKGLMAQGVFKYYANHYADWLATNRTDSEDRAQSWKAPNYGIFDFHLIYSLPELIKDVKLQFFGHVFNVLDQIYVQDAVDNSKYNAFTGDNKNHKADDAEVYLGLPRTFNLGFSVIW